jgi:plastocyanin
LKTKGWVISGVAFAFLLTSNVAVRGDNNLLLTNNEQGKGQMEQTPNLQGIKVKTFYIDIPNREKAGNSNFNPVKVKIKAGNKIVWTNNDSRTHFISSMSNCDYPGSGCEEPSDEVDVEEEEEEENQNNLISDTFVFTSDYLVPGKTFTYTFKNVGVYKYYCFTHPLEMTGFIEVE